MNKYTRIFVWCLAVGVSLMMVYQVMEIIESPVGFMDPNNKVTVFEGLTLSPDEVYTYSAKTTQGNYHVFSIIREGNYCPKIEVLDENDDLIQLAIYACMIDLSVLEKEKTYRITLTNSERQDMIISGYYVFDDRPYWVTDVLPRNGIFLDLIGFSLMIFGGIIFGIGKIHSRRKISN